MDTHMLKYLVDHTDEECVRRAILKFIKSLEYCDVEYIVEDAIREMEIELRMGKKITPAY